MAIHFEDLNRAFSEFIKYTKYLRDNPVDPTEIEEERLKAFREDTIIREKRRKEGFFSAYSLNNEDPKEIQRVKSLQLICFKVANHKQQIISLLEKYQQVKDFSRPGSAFSEEEEKSPSKSQLLDPNKGHRRSINRGFDSNASS